MSFCKNYIGGEWVESETGKRFERRNPANGELVAEYTEKYGEWMQRLGITTESMAERYTSLIEFTPLKAILQ